MWLIVVVYVFCGFMWIKVVLCGYKCGGGGIVGNHVWVTVVVCTCMLSCTPLKVFAWALGYYIYV